MISALCAFALPKVRGLLVIHHRTRRWNPTAEHHCQLYGDPLGLQMWEERAPQTKNIRASRSRTRIMSPA